MTVVKRFKHMILIGQFMELEVDITSTETSFNIYQTPLSTDFTFRS